MRPILAQHSGNRSDDDLSRCEHANLGAGHSVSLKRNTHLTRHQTGLRNLDFQGVFLGLHRQRADSKAGAHVKASDRLDLAGNSSPTAGIRPYNNEQMRFSPQRYCSVFRSILACALLGRRSAQGR